MDQDRNLLFGVFAAQLTKVTPSQIMEHAAAWAMDPSRDLSQRLIDDGVISAEDRSLIANIVDQAVNSHNGDASSALDTFGPQREVDMVRSYAELQKMFSSDVVRKLEDWFDGVNYNEVRHRSKEAFEIAGRDPVEHLVNVCSKLISGEG